MAKQLNVNLKVSADIAAAQQSLRNLTLSLDKIKNQSSTLISPIGLQQAQEAARSLEIHLSKAINVNTNKLDLTKFSLSLKQANQDLTTLSAKLLRGGQAGQQAFNALTHSISTASNASLFLGEKLNSLLTTLQNTVRWQISSSILHGFMRTIQGAYTYAQKLNKSLTDIQIVTEASSEKMAKFAKEANKAAQALSTTTNTYAKAALIYYQQGLDDKQVKERTDLTVKMANVTGNTAKTVSEQLTAIWNNFDDGSRSLESYIDVITALGASTASSTTEIAEGLEKFAAIARTVGLSYEYATSALATVVAKTRQSADVVGTAFKTLFARIQDLELGKTLDDGTTLGRYSQALATIGVNIKDANGELKDMDDILNELGAKWDQIDRSTQVAVAQTVGGTRQYQQLIAILDNWDYMQENLNVAAGSEGTLSRQAEIYAESWEAAKNRVKAAAEEIYSTLLDDKFFISITNGFGKFLDIINNIVTSLGGMRTVLFAIMGLMSQKIATQMPALFAGIGEGAKSFAKKTAISFGLNASSKLDSQQEMILKKNAELANNQYQSRASNEYVSATAKGQAKINATEASLAYKINDSSQRWNAAEQERNKILQEELQTLSQIYLKQCQIVDKTTESTGEAREDFINTLDDDKREAWLAAHPGEKYSNQVRGQHDRYTRQASDIIENNARDRAHAKFLTDRHSSQMDDFRIELKNVENMPVTTKKQRAEKAKAELSLRQSINSYYDTLQDDRAMQGADGRSAFGRAMQARRNNPKMSNVELLALGDDKNFMGYAENKIKSYNQAINEQLDKLKPEIKNKARALVDKAVKDEVAKDTMKTMETQLDEPDKKTNERLQQTGATLGALASTAVATASAISMVAGAISVLGNDSATTGEKIMAVVTTLTVLIPLLPTIASGINTLAVAFKTAGKSAAVAGAEGAAAGTAVQLAWWQITLIMLAIVAAVTAVIVVFKLLSNVYNKDKLAAEEAAKSAAALAEQYDKVKSAYDEMMKSISSYEDAEKALDKLTKGTKEYEEALKDANKQARALIQANKLKEGQDYEITSDGQIKIKDEALRRIQDESLSQVNSAEAISEMANINAQKAQAKADRTALKRKNDGVNAWGRIGAGVGAVLLNGFLPGLGAWLGANAIGNLEQTAKARQESTDAVIDAIRDGNLNLSGDMSRAEFEKTLKTAVNNGDLSIDLNDSKLIQALYDSRDAMQELADAENAAKEAQKQAAKQYARDIFGMDENLVASGSINDLAEMGQKIIIASEEAALDSFKQAYKDNGEEITKKYLELYGDTLGDNVKYKGKGKYTYTDESGKTKTKKISEDILKNFYSTTQGETTLKANQQRIVEAYNATATNAAARAALVNQNFESITRQQFEQFKFSSEQELAKALGAYEGEDLDEFAKKVLGSESWQDYLTTIQKAEEDAKKAWASFNGTAVQQLAEVEGISLETAQRFMNIMNDMKNNPLYSQHANIITQGIKDLAGGSTEALDALSQLDYTSYDIGHQIKNTLSKLGIELAMSEADFENWVKKIRQTENTVPTFNDLLTSLIEINNVLKEIDFGELISDEDYEKLVAYDNKLKDLFQYTGEKWRFIGDKDSVAQTLQKSVENDLKGLKEYITISERFRANKNLTTLVKVDSGLEGDALQERRDTIAQTFNDNNVWQALQEAGGEGYTAEWLKTAPVAEINEMIDFYNNVYNASQKSEKLMDTLASQTTTLVELKKLLDENSIDQKAYDKQAEYILGYAKEAASKLKEIEASLEHINNLLSRQSKITDTLYGADKLASMEKESQILDQQIEKTKAKIDLLKQEVQTEMSKLAQEGVQFAEDGEMLNGYQLARAGLIDPNKINTYQTLWKQFIEAQDDLFDEQIGRLNKNYEKLTEILEQKLDRVDMAMTRLDYHFSRMEDNVYKAAEAFGLLQEKQDLNVDSLEAYKSLYESLEAKRAAGEITPAQYIEGLKEVYNSIYDNLDALYELDKEMREYYTDFLSNMNEEIEKYTKTFEYLTKLTEHYKNIMELTGDSKDYDKMELLYTASLKNIDNKLQVAKVEMDAAQAQYDFLMSQPNKLEEDVESATNQLQEKTEAYFETLEEKIEATQNLVKNGLDRAAAQLEKTLTGGTTFERLNQSMSMMSKFSELFYTTTNQVYETQKRINNVTQELAKTTNKNYQNELKMWKMRLESAQKQEKLSKNQLALMDAEFKLIQARAAFEEAQNAKSTVRLTRDAEGNYGYVFTADQENITKAQQAVQDAENELYNKQLEIANKNAELIVQIQQEMFEKIKEINDDLTLSAEERELRIQEIYQQYSPYILALTNDRNMAISYSEENTAKIMRDAWSMTFEETIKKCSSWQEAYQTYTEQCSKYLDKWYKVVEEVTEKAGLNFDTLKEKMSNITKESDAIRKALIGEDGKGGIVQALKEVGNEILNKTTAYAEFANNLQAVASGYLAIAAAIEQAVEAAQKAENITGDTSTTNKFSYEPTTPSPNPNGNDNNNNDNDDLPEQQDVVTWVKNVLDGNNSYFDEYDRAQLADYFASTNGNYEKTWERIKEILDDKQRLLKEAKQISIERNTRPEFIKTNRKTLPDNRNTGEMNTRKWYNSKQDLDSDIIVTPTGSKFVAFQDGYVPYDSATIHSESNGKWCIDVKPYTPLWQIKTPSYDTGGYTGKWGPEGKLATLHEKELVLNKQDTQNILAAVSLIRQIASAIDLQALMQSFGLLSVGATKIGTLAHANLEQKVEITAQFPNAIYHDEIKEAFDTLINRASQYANRNY